MRVARSPRQRPRFASDWLPESRKGEFLALPEGRYTAMDFVTRWTRALGRILVAYLESKLGGPESKLGRPASKLGAPASQRTPVVYSVTRYLLPLYHHAHALLICYCTYFAALQSPSRCSLATGRRHCNFIVAILISHTVDVVYYLDCRSQ